MKPSKNARKGGAPAPKNGEGPGTRHTRALKINRKNKHAHDNGSLTNGKQSVPAKVAPRPRAAKTIDSRTAVLAKARQTRIAKAIEVTSPERIAELHAIRDAYPGNSVQVQCERLLAMIKQTGHISTFEAMRYGDVFDPRARKLNLKKLGHAIDMVWRWVTTESGDLHRVGVYFMSTEVDSSPSRQHDLFLGTSMAHPGCETAEVRT